jgi:hypothetical protein
VTVLARVARRSVSPVRWTPYDAFAEFQMPLVEGKPGVELLSIEGAYRYSDYSTGISVRRVQDRG